MAGPLDRGAPDQAVRLLGTSGRAGGIMITHPFAHVHAVPGVGRAADLTEYLTEPD